VNADVLLIITHRKGFEADRIIDRLGQLRRDFFRLNTDISDTVCGQAFYELSISSTGVSGRLTCDGRSVCSSDITSAWYQQPPNWDSTETPLERARQLSHASAIEGFAALLPCRWLNEPRFAHAAANKARQLIEAQRIGLAVPRTLVTNDPMKVRALFEDESGLLVTKSVAPQWLSIDGVEMAAYTRQPENDILCDDDSISYAPVTYQKFYKRALDVRVVVVGNSAFAVSYGSSKPDAVHDVRKDTHVKYERYSVPPIIVARLKELLKLLSINYCAADFIETADGELLFLELNVSGSWWWVDDAYGGAVTDAFAGYLGGE
jgi:hypothetical protein